MLVWRGGAAGGAAGGVARQAHAGVVHGGAAARPARRGADARAGRLQRQRAQPLLVRCLLLQRARRLRVRRRRLRLD